MLFKTNPVKIVELVLKNNNVQVYMTPGMCNHAVNMSATEWLQNTVKMPPASDHRVRVQLHPLDSQQMAVTVF